MTHGPDGLITSVTELLDRAVEQSRSTQARDALTAARDRLTGPLRVAVAGRIKAGKSTLVNALLGRALAASDAGECTRVVTWYSWASEPQIRLIPRSGTPVDTRFEIDDELVIDLGGRDAGDLLRIEVGWPVDTLRTLTLVDTPGLSSLSAEVSDRTVHAVTPGGGAAQQIDAVVYLLRYAHSTDIEFLEAFRGDGAVGVGPVNTVGVLSRADEIGACRTDAMTVAERVARRYADDPRVRRVCPVVVPVDGLLAIGAESLDESEVAALRVFADSDPSAVMELLLSADRWRDRPSSIPVDPAVRASLLDQLGLFGVRHAVDLLCGGLPTDQLALALREVSGFGRLQDVLASQFAERAGVLKARTALAALDSALRGDQIDGADLLAQDVERVLAGAHAFREIALLDQLRAGEIRLSEEQLADLDRLLGGSGQSAAARLGWPGTRDSGPPDLHAALENALLQWRNVAEHPLVSGSGRAAAAVAQRTLEGILRPPAAAR